MKKQTSKSIFSAFLGILASMALTGCGGSDSDTSNNPNSQSGYLEFVPGSTVRVALDGGPRDVILDLVGSTGVVGQVVTFTIADPEIATVFRPRNFKCSLSSDSLINSECTIQITAKAAGTTVLTATSSGYEPVKVEIVSTAAGSIDFGQLAVRTAEAEGSRLVTSSQVTHEYDKSKGSLVLTTKLVGSFDAKDTQISFTAPKGTVASPATCVVTSNKPDCTTKISGLPSTEGTSSAITITGSSKQGAGKTHTPIVVNAVAKSNASSVNGRITLMTSTGEENGFMPQGIKIPIYIRPEATYAQPDKVNIDLTLQVWDAKNKQWVSSASSYPASLYFFDSSGNVTPKSYTTTGSVGVPTCSLTLYADSFANPLSTCGYGLWADPSQLTGQIRILPTVTSTNGLSYTMEPLVVDVTSEDVVARQTTFTNSSASNSVWLAINPGMALAYVAPAILAVNNASAKQNAYCGPSAVPANSVACPSGSSCLWTGANYPSKGTPIYQCAYDTGKLVNSNSATSGASFYVLSPNNANTITHSISAYAYQTPTQYALSDTLVLGSYNPNAPKQYSAGTYWSGAYIPRTGCDTSTGICDVGSCGVSDMSCPPGVGATNILTKSEPAYQKYVASGSAEMDQYDVSLMGGANVQASFAPTSTKILKGYNGSAYFCGTPGASQGQYLGVINSDYNAYSSKAGIAALPAASWKMSAGISTSSFPSGVSVASTALAQSYYRVVKVLSADSGAACDASSTNPGTCANANESCGNTLSSITTSTTQSLQCGSVVVGWIPPYQLLQLNTGATSPVFFPTWSSSPTLQQYQLCTGPTFTAYKASSGYTAQNACGGVAWGAAETPTYGGTATPAQNTVTSSQKLGYASSNWNDNVFPTISWLKQACPTCYSFAFDDPTSTFSCAVSSGQPDEIKYTVTYGDLN